MSTYALAQRGVLALTSADTSPKDVTLASSIKTGSAQLHAVVRDTRRNASVQRGTVTLAEAATSPQDVTITAVDLACAHVKVSFRDSRDPAAGGHGVSAKLTSSTNLRLQFYGAVGAGENIEIEWEVVEQKPARSATVRVLDANTVRVEWDGTLAAGETITVAYEVWDISPIGDDIKEILFRLMRALGYLGENCRQDLCQYDDAGNCIQYRLRIFDSRANAEASDLDLPLGSGLQDGEIARAIVTQDIDTGKNDRIDIMQVLDTVIATPGVG